MAFAPTFHSGSETQSLYRIARAVEARGPSPSGHLERVGAYTALLAERLGLDPDPLRDASTLHDIGNVTVPEAILQSPAALTSAEREIVRGHARAGHDLLADAGSEPLDLAALIALTHHERYDGSGYPHRLRGREIPEAGRIVAVADVLDALTTDRPYRAALSLEAAVEELRRGPQFDPAVLHVLVLELDAVRAILAEHPGAAASHAQPEPPPELMSLGEAAAALGVSVSRLRRWADAGRIDSVRTAGGHRRFPVQAIRRHAAEHHSPARLRRVRPPSEPLPLLARVLQRHGAELTALVAPPLYQTGMLGWFARLQSQDARRDWVDALVHAAETGRYTYALDKTEAFLRQAAVQGCSLLERYAYLEHFGRATLRVLARSAGDNEEALAARTLFLALQQALLEGDPRGRG